MPTHASGTVRDGQVTLDTPLDLPDQSRVWVTVRLDPNWRTRYAQGLDRFLKHIREHPIHIGERFRREDLYDRH